MAEQIVTTITTSMGSFASGAGDTIVNVFDAVFIKSGEGAEQITNFGIYSLVFVGIGVVTGVIGSIVAKVG